MPIRSWNDIGFLVAPIAVAHVRSYVTRLHELDWEHLLALYAEMEQAAQLSLGELGIRAEDTRLVRSAEMRYAGQGYEIAVPVSETMLRSRSVDGLVDAFYASYRSLFGRAPHGIPIETMTWRLAASGPRPAPALQSRTADPPTGDPLKGRRPVYFPDGGSFLDTNVYDRYALAPGTELSGPAVVEERESTVVIGPRSRALIDQHLNLVIQLP